MDPHHGRGSRHSQASSSTSQQQRYSQHQHQTQHHPQQQRQQRQRTQGASGRGSDHGVPKDATKSSADTTAQISENASSSSRHRSKSSDRISSSGHRKRNEAKSFDRTPSKEKTENDETRSLVQSKHRMSSDSRDRREPGTPASLPKNRRRARSSSRLRESTADHETDGKYAKSQSHRLTGDDGVTLERSGLTAISASVSYSERTPDKITKDETRRMSLTSVRDNSIQSTKSEKTRFSRATSVPKEIRSYRECKPVLEENQSHIKRQSQYDQHPESGSDGRNVSVARSSYLKSRPQFGRSDSKRPIDINETGISLANFTPQTHQRHHSTGSSSRTSAGSERNFPVSRTAKKAGSFSSRSYQDISFKSRRTTSMGNHRGTCDSEIDEDGERSSHNFRSSVEEPLLPQTNNNSSVSHQFQRQMPEGSAGTIPKANIQTFPRMKQPESISSSPPTYPVSSATIDRFKAGKTHFLLDRIRHFTPNQLSSQEPYFSPLHKVPSLSSTSSDARSEVCLDLPDQPEDGEEDIYPEHGDLRIKLDFPDAPYTPIAHFTESHICRTILTHILGFFVSFLMIWPLLATVLVIVPIVLIIKRLCNWCCFCGKYLWGRCCLCFCHTHLTSSEMVWLARHSRTNPVVQSLVVLQKGLDTERIRNLIDSRLLSVENRHGRKLYPRFTQKVVQFCCGRAWVSDRNFVTSNHVFNMPGYIESLDDLQQFISKMASEPMSFKHPLWEVQILHNFREPRDTVLLFRMHLCMTDGVSMIQVLEHALVDSQKASNAKSTFSSEVANMSPFKVLFSAPFTFISRYMCGRPDFNLLHGRHLQQSGETVVAWSEPFSLSAALRVKQVARCTLADLLLSITAGNIRTYLQVCGIKHPYNITCAIPVDFQSLDGGPLDMENKYAVVRIPLPTNTEGSIPRLWEVKNTMERFKATAEAAIVNGARWLSFSLLPISCFQRMWRKIYSHCTLLVSNLSGPTSVLKLDSREIKCMMYWIPLLDKVSVAISFLTYADQIRMAVISDRSALPNPELLTRDFNHKLETLSNLLAHRRIPGETASSRQQNNVHLLSSFTMEDLTADQLKLEMSLVQRELHDLKIQLDAGPSNHISQNDTQVMHRIEALKERSRELMMHLRKRKAEEAESAVAVVSDEEDIDDLDKPPRSFRRRTLSMSSKMSTTSVSSTARPLSTASTSNLPSPTHPMLPSWPEGDIGIKELDEFPLDSRLPFSIHSRHSRSPISELDSPVESYQNSSQTFQDRSLQSDFT